MIREKPIFRRRLKTFWRQTLEATLGLKYISLYGIPRLLLQHLGRNEPIHLVDIGAYDGAFTFGLACCCGLLSGVMVETLPHKAAALKKRFRRQEYRVHLDRMLLQSALCRVLNFRGYLWIAGCAGGSGC